MKFADIAKKTSDELAKLEKDLHLELMKLRAQSASGAASKESGKIRQIKKDLARIKMAGGVRKQ